MPYAVLHSNTYSCFYIEDEMPQMCSRLQIFPSIWIMDEASSALVSRLEHECREAKR